MSNYQRLKAEDFISGRSYKIGDLHYGLTTFSGYYFNSPTGYNSDIYEKLGLSREEVDEFIGYKTMGDCPVLKSRKDVARFYNWLNDKWFELNGDKIDLGNGDSIILPYEIKSQEDWDSIWPKLKKAGFVWSDGEDLNEIFSECHDFPQFITQLGSLKLTIND